MKEEEDEEEIQPMNENPATPVEQPQPQDTAEQKPEEKKYKISIAEKYKEIIMKSIKEKTGINGLNALLFLLVCIILVYLGIFETLITNLVGTIYPGYYTIKAIERKENKKEWLTYWVIFGAFIIFDMSSNIIMKIVPFYFVLKILFLIWMFLPESKGRKLVYNFLIYKLFKLIEESVDFFFNESKIYAKHFYQQSKNASILKIQQLNKGLKVFKGSLLKSRDKLDMDEAVRAAQELDREEEKKGGIFASTLPTFPKKFEQKYFNEDLEEISKRIIMENNQENKDENGNTRNDTRNKGRKER